MRAFLLQCLCLLALLACSPVHAQVYHCTGVHGEPVFSGQPCGLPAPAGAGTASASPGNDPGGVCAISPQALRQSIAEAFTAHDVNRLAGLILWRGMDAVSARAAMQSLAGWLKQPLSGIAIAYATGPPPLPGEPAPDSTEDPADSVPHSPIGFEIETDGGNTRNFGLIESGGCWWLTF